MMLSVIVGGTTYSLDDGTYCVLVGHDGWGMAPSHRLTERGPMQHGETDRGMRLDARYASLALKLPVTDLNTMYSRRNSLIGLFAPQNSPTLAWEMAYGTRYIDVHGAGEMGMPWQVDQWAAQTVGVRLVAPDPTFYDPVAEAVTFALGGGSSALVIPMTVPMVVGASTLASTNTITYAGNWLSEPHLIRITGPIEDCLIENLTTEEELSFDGVTIAAGDYYDIDCRYGYKTVKDSAGANQIADLTEDSDLATFHLAAPPEAPGGVNSIRVTGLNATAATQVQITYYVRYLGL